MRISEVLSNKPSHAVVTITPDATVRDLLAMLAEHNVGAVVVSAGGQAVDGIVSERDVVRRLNDDDAVLDGPVSAIMTSDVRTCEPDTPVDDLRVMMTERRIRHVPVVESGRLTGIISIGDVVKSSLDQLRFERDQLDSYVHQT
ncbi:MAG TPA: CBS domain-containing protein [Nocardioides sp.]|jgi:CBS domain-containing protein|uniref:CBS domain-containing protein n=1 Tax=Nocardioides sp. TaxID=35761 RepID=UPI002E2F96D1|nr:CBS domain-containing protein [Nocardioides sp.]HEX3931858.1 CBS domain-containing protein [Nocardioides sp.]